MANRANRARRRHARIKAQVKDLIDREQNATTAEERLTASGELVELLRRVADSDMPLWSIKDQLLGREDGGTSAREDAEATRAMLAQLVAPQLAGRPPRSVRLRTAE